METSIDELECSGSSNADVLRRYFRVLILVSVILSLVTFASYAFAGNGTLSTVLFQIGLGGENNIGAWWSGMLLLLAAIHAFDGYSCSENSTSERRGWLTLAITLFILSFDEVSSVHEFVANVGGRTAWLPLGAFGFALIAYSVVQLAKSGIGKRAITLILLSFAMFGTVVLQEHFQHALSWNDPVVYGIRAFIEEGTEIVAMLILISVTMANTQRAIEEHRTNFFEATEVLRQPILIASALMLPVLVGATFVLPFPGGPADWLAASLYLICALRVIREVLIEKRRVDTKVSLLFFLYIGASALSNVLSLSYDPTIFGVPVSLRGLGICMVLIIAGPIMRSNGRKTSGLLIYFGAIVAFIAIFYPQSQLIWCTIPPAVAIWIYSMETKVKSSRLSEA